jgi:hypothetical protein
MFETLIAELWLGIGFKPELIPRTFLLYVGNTAVSDFHISYIRNFHKGPPTSKQKDINLNQNQVKKITFLCNLKFWQDLKFVLNFAFATFFFSFIILSWFFFIFGHIKTFFTVPSIFLVSSYTKFHATVTYTERSNTVK